MVTSCCSQETLGKQAPLNRDLQPLELVVGHKIPGCCPILNSLPSPQTHWSLESETGERHTRSRGWNCVPGGRQSSVLKQQNWSQAKWKHVHHQDSRSNHRNPLILWMIKELVQRATCPVLKREEEVQVTEKSMCFAQNHFFPVLKFSWKTVTSLQMLSGSQTPQVLQFKSKK